MVSLYRALEQEKNDITEYLKYSVAAKEKEGDELVVKLEKLQQAAERDREALELQHRQEQQELQEQRDELDSVVTGQGETTRRLTNVNMFITDECLDYLVTVIISATLTSDHHQVNMKDVDKNFEPRPNEQHKFDKDLTCSVLIK